ncbi:MAG: diguanylate cyclase [Gammaproteobacteria bacterium]|nr:diguanylate cyclase [Gammaproteobacteria bacterium]
MNDVIQADIQANSPQSETHSPAALKPHILIVDDSPTIRVSLNRAVQGEFLPVEAEDGEQAWEFISSDERIEILITDLSMPRLDGYKLIERIRNSIVGRIRNIPIIVVTGADDTAAREKAFAAGANDFVTKTCDRVELQARLRAHQKLAQTIRALEASQRELREQVNTDALTALPNRRFFDQLANREMSLMRRQEEHFAVLMMDIDHFKIVNDTYGHPAGDHVLKQVARILAVTAREEDTVARIGGEEFVVGSPYTNRLAAMVLAERLRKAVESLKIEFEGVVIPITISIGIAQLSQDGELLDALIAAADKRLYIAKQKGRNRFCAADKQREDKPPNLLAACPKMGEALSMIRHANLSRLTPHLHELLRELMPLLELANMQVGALIDLAQVQKAIDRLAEKASN